MISFIIIGRNEEKYIDACIKSVVQTIKVNNLKDSEIIYVDSNSSDNTIKLVQKYQNVKIYKITKGWNLPVARNIGAQHAKCESLFFLDGDMTIEPSFINAAFSNGSLKYNFVTGALYEYQYNVHCELINECWRTKPKESVKRIYLSCGVFIIKKRIWCQMNGMDARMKKGADFDLCMRLYEAGIDMYQLQEKCANHYTISYIHSDRLWSTIRNGSVLYAKSILYRRYIKNKPMILTFLFSDYTAITLIVMGILSLIMQSLIPLILYIVIILFKTIKQKNITFKNRISLIPYYLIRDLIVIFGILFFYPKNHKVIYEKVK